MKNEIGKKNMIFGFAYFITTLILGLYLASEAEEAMPGVEENPLLELLSHAHSHGNLESVLNILVGYILCQLEASSWLLNAVSILLLIGAIFHSGMLYISGLGVASHSILLPSALSHL